MKIPRNLYSSKKVFKGSFPQAKMTDRTCKIIFGILFVALALNEVFAMNVFRIHKLPIRQNIQLESLFSRDLIKEASDFIAVFEDLKLEAYDDTKARAICYGNTIKFVGSKVSPEICRKKLEKRVQQISNFIDEKFAEIPRNINQQIALISLYYNVRNPIHIEWRIKNGMSEKSVRNSWLSHDSAEVCEKVEEERVCELVRLGGLTARRKAEVKLFFKQTK